MSTGDAGLPSQAPLNRDAAPAAVRTPAAILRRTGPWLALAAGAALPTLAAALGLDFYVSLASRILILAMLATSLNLLVGLGGMISLGHAAFYGTGAYAVAIAAFESAGRGPLASALVAWPLAIAAGALLALVVGAVSMRTRGPYFIMITLAFAQAVYYVVVSLKRYGGDDGLSLPGRSGVPGLNLGDDATFYYVVLALVAASIALFVRLAGSRFGRVLQAIKDNEVRAESLGYPCTRYKLVAFVIAGAWAALAGALMANHGSFVSPNLLHWEQSGTALVILILGGIGQPWGGLAGAAAYLLIEEAFSAVTQRWAIGLGAVLLAVVYWAPNGIAGAIGRARHGAFRRRATPAADAGPGAAAAPAGPPAAPAVTAPHRLPSGAAVPAADAASAARGDALLRLDGLHKRFGGVVATDGVSLDVRRGETHAVIGPNGAGKSTLISQVSGSLAPDRGAILFDGAEVTRLAAHERAARGFARSFQITSVFPHFTVVDNVALAVQARAGSSLRFWRPVADESALLDAARAIVADVGLGAVAAVPAGALSHGEHRQLELGLALAMRPKLLLLDEPMAGMGPDESARMLALIERLKRRHTIVLVEHDMDAVFRLADRISVLVAGRLVATGSPDAIRADPQVRAAYLGDDEGPA